MPSAAAERKIAPTLVGFTTFSKTAIRFAPLQTSSMDGSGFLYMAQSIPLVNINPVSCVKTSNSAV